MPERSQAQKERIIAMKHIHLGILAALMLSVFAGCTRIVKIEPTSGPPGTPVYIKCSGMFGDPCCRSLKWDGDTIKKPFPGSFCIPAVDQGGDPGRHTVTLVDNLDASEAFLIFPIFRVRQDSVSFTVTGP